MKPVIRVNAKINLCLRILGRRSDGFHEIVTVMHPIALHDEISIEPRDGFELECDSPEAPKGEENSVYRAWSLMRELAPARIGGCRIVLHKNIPAQAGLGGASADAAGALLALNRVFDAGLDWAALGGLAARIGSDVPFFLGAGPALAEGRGERLTPAEGGLRSPLMLALSARGVSTAEAYGRFAPGGDEEGRDVGAMKEALREGDEIAVAAALFNTFERLVFPLRPDLADTKEGALRAGARGALLTGSGASIFAMGLDETKAPRLAGGRWIRTAFHALPHEWLM